MGWLFLDIDFVKWKLKWSNNDGDRIFDKYFMIVNGMGILKKICKCEIFLKG